MLLGKNQKMLVAATDFGMLVYWLLVFLNFLEIISLDPEYMYSDYGDPTIVAWNLSFLPIDLAFSVLGLIGIFYALADKTKELFNVISLSLMFCAGIMAISFWLIVADYKIFWWLINLWLVVLPVGLLLNWRAQDQAAR